MTLHLGSTNWDQFKAK